MTTKLAKLQEIYKQQRTDEEQVWLVIYGASKIRLYCGVCGCISLHFIVLVAAYGSLQRDIKNKRNGRILVFLSVVIAVTSLKYVLGLSSAPQPKQA